MREALGLRNEFPAVPLLDISEIPEPSDLREQVPELSQYLGDDEMVVKIERPLIRQQSKYPSALKQMMRLAGVSTTFAIGDSGPSVASLAFPENADEKSLTKFESPFGRDSLIVALLLKDRYPELLRATVLHLAAKQGTKYDSASGEEPGAILHDDHDPKDDLSRKFEHYFGWRFPTFGTVDATPLFVRTIHEVVQREGLGFLNETYINSEGDQKTIGESLVRSLAWITARCDRNPEGLLEYYKPAFRGMDNQAWKDSYHAYVHKDGELANHESGIASVEVQAYAYDALLFGAEMVGDHDLAEDLKMRAEKMRKMIYENFWVENELGGYFGLATDRDSDGRLRLMTVRSSNMGQLLNTQLFDESDPEDQLRVESIIRNLFSPEMLSDNGIRTLASDEASFNPSSYHNGGIWPHDNAITAAGLERQGYYGAAHHVNRKICEIVESTLRFPELIKGNNGPVSLSERNVYVWDKSKNMVYLLERVPQEVQAWAVAGVIVAKSKNPIPGPSRQHMALPVQAVDPNKRKLEAELLSR